MSEIVVDNSIEPRRVDASHGWLWLKQAFTLYRASWLQWTAMTMLMMAILIGLSLVPLLAALASIIAPVLIAGMMLAAQRASRGDTFEVLDLFDGFKVQTKPLLMVGALYFLLTVAVFAVTDLFAKYVLHLDIAAIGAMLHNSGQPPARASGDMLQYLLLMLLSLVIVYSTYFFAPTLVMLRDARPVESMRISVTAFWRNWPAMLLLGVLLGALGVLSVFTMLLGLIVALPLGMLVTYTAFVDIFPEG